ARLAIAADGEPRQSEAHRAIDLRQRHADESRALAIDLDLEIRLGLLQRIAHVARARRLLEDALQFGGALLQLLLVFAEQASRDRSRRGSILPASRSSPETAASPPWERARSRRAE